MSHRGAMVALGGPTGPMEPHGGNLLMVPDASAQIRWSAGPLVPDLFVPDPFAFNPFAPDALARDPLLLLLNSEC